MLDLRALLASALVNLLIAALGASPGGDGCPCGAGEHGFRNPGRPRESYALPGPQLLIVASLPSIWSLNGVAPIDDRLGHDRECPLTGGVDQPARLTLPSLSDASLTGLLDGLADNPEVCARIATDGRVTGAFVMRSTGRPRTDARLLRMVRGMRFEPAREAGRPIAAWHWLIVNRARRIYPPPEVPLTL